ncbi:MAG TPA: M28 family metallopeptidase [Dokdonella sp.]|uniref:M28 family metallopeptidase n=1 Tax=Dokdonella sp. TaxID=2291710 RepID=UPI002D80709B|nr:M28 family metallopeptidase [Dokdonella sp.]HET9034076.1 M28 family metallopeptidase [Dokdonella sp.]
MMRPLIACSMLLTLVACGQQEAPTTAPSPAETVAADSRPAPVVPTPDGKFSAQIKAEDFAARLKKLSSDQFEGRQPGTIGERVTTAYIKDQFERIGLKPGNNGNWFQTVPMVQTTLQNPADVKIKVKGAKGESDFGIGKDSVINSLNGSLDVKLVDSPIIFAGYGVDAPDWNDYADIDVKGKTVIVLVNDPGWGNDDAELFKGKTLTYYGRWTYKYEEAARKGAAALFIVHETPGAGYPWEVVQNGWSGPQLALPASEDPAPRLETAGWFSEDAATRLFASAGADFAALKKSADLRGFKPVELDATLSVEYHSVVETTSSENVIGVLPGSERADEAIVYTAHWDHLGKDESLEGDQIYNGAIDNATGVAGIMEIAEAFVHQPTPPKRSVVFAAVTLEESGLLGAQYFVAHSPFALDKTVANINIDALPINGPAKNLTVIGLGQSELDEYAEAAAKSQGRVVTADASPEKGYFFRSDHVNFARAGVPALYAMSGLDLVEGGEEAGRKAADDYTANRYHKPGDNYDPNWDYRGVIEDLDLLYAVGRKLADESTFPQWKPGADFSRPAKTDK